MKKDVDPIKQLSQVVIANWPMKPRTSKGTRDKQRNALILSLLNRKRSPDVIKEVGKLWLAHFRSSDNTYYEMDYESAVRDFNDCVDRTKDSLPLTSRTKSSNDYLEEARNIILTPEQEGIVGGVILPQLRKNNIPCACTPYSWTDIDKLILEALIVIARVELAKGIRKDENTGKIKMALKYADINAYLAVRGKPTLQVQHISSKYMPRFLNRGRPGETQKLHLLTRTVKGLPGFASEYELTPIFLAILGVDPDLSRPATPPKGKEPASLATGGAASIKPGPEDLSRPATPGKPKEKPKKSKKQETEEWIANYEREHNIYGDIEESDSG